MKSIVLVTNHYPHGQAEAFVHYELPFLRQKFGRLIILSRDVESPTLRSVDYTNYRRNPKSSWGEGIRVVCLMARRATEVVNLLLSEIAFLKKQKKLSISILRKAAHDLFKAYCTTHSIESILKKEQITGEVTLYSYWLTSTALGVALVRGNTSRRLTKVARAHGGDVYAYRNELQYLSFRTALASRLNNIYPISDNAHHYLISIVGSSFAHKFVTQRLGTPATTSNAEKSSNKYTLVSCSFVSANKRVGLLLDALTQITDLDLHWIHLGGGPLLKEIAERYNQLQSQLPRLTVTFKGNMSSSEIEQFYTNTFVDLFVNTSLQEGIPVSIMEALSYGIPVLATDVGAVSEIVDGTVGQLMPAEQATPIGISQHIVNMLLGSEVEKNQLRKRCRERWQQHYNDVKNFSTFASLLYDTSHETT